MTGNRDGDQQLIPVEQSSGWSVFLSVHGWVDGSPAQQQREPCSDSHNICCGTNSAKQCFSRKPVLLLQRVKEGAGGPTLVDPVQSDRDDLAEEAEWLKPGAEASGFV